MSTSGCIFTLLVDIRGVSLIITRGGLLISGKVSVGKL